MIENPALKQFVARMGSEVVWAQVLIRRAGSGYELRQVEDREAAAATLRTIQLSEARGLAQFTAAGEFRPLKSAPTLRRGWRLAVANDAELEAALNHFYPGGVADWHAALAEIPPVTNYREFARRQSGMYRVTTLLRDAEAEAVVVTICSAELCLKRRLWTVGSLKADAAGLKSLIPCLEPCAIMMDAARLKVRAGQRVNAEGLATCAEGEQD